jgi:hypothetical protein
VEKCFVDMKMSEGKGDFGMPKVVIGFPDAGIDPKQSNGCRGNEQYTAGSFLVEKLLGGS